MPLERNGKKPLVPSHRDGIDCLPDGVLEHILGFLEAQEAVRTCVLAKRWRHLWKSATGMRIMYVYVNESTALKKFRQFVDRLLDSRGLTPLETCEISLDDPYIYDQDYVDMKLCLNRWIRHVVLCQVQMLKLRNLQYMDFEPDDLPLVSRYLTRLELCGVDLISSFCDFSSCLSLQNLEIDNCCLCHAKKISSESLKCLSITNCIFSKEFRTLIDVPLLVSLRLDGHLYMAPVLQGMPALQEAYVTIQCEAYYMRCSYEGCYSCYGIVHGQKKSVLLDNLSVAENLALICESKAFIFSWDLNWCPIFSKLKTLLLNESWCVAPDFRTLTCILKNSPVLEKLTLQLFSKGPEYNVKMVGRYNSMERSAAISEHLKAIEIKCQVVDEEVSQVLKLLCTFNICK